MIILMHRADSWPTVRLIYTFSLCSDSVNLFKPTKSHKMKSSFYLVVKGIDPKSQAALRAVERWKAQWKFATFGKDVISNEERETLGRTEDMEAKVVLQNFGEELLALTEPVFRLQAEALRNSPWVKNLRREEKLKERSESKDEALAIQLGTLGLGEDTDCAGQQTNM